MEEIPDKSYISGLVESLLKYRGTNYSQVASKMTGKNGKPMSRQVLHRMVHNGTISLATFVQMARALDLTVTFDQKDSDAFCLTNVKGERIRQKIKGVAYDTDKMFSVFETDKGKPCWMELCWEPVHEKYLWAHYCNEEFATTDEGRKFPYLELTDLATAERAMLVSAK